MSDYVHVQWLDQTAGVEHVEDEIGTPILLVDGDDISAHHFQRAYDEAVSLIVNRVTGHAISVEEFMVERVEVPSTMTYRVSRWRSDVSFPSGLDYATARDQRPVDDGPVDPLASTTFVHLHTHSEYSTLDGLGTLGEIVNEAVVGQRQGALGITDHGNCACHPELQDLASKFDFRPVFGMEAYFQDDRFRRTRNWVELDGVEVDPVHLSKSEVEKAERCSDSSEARWGYTHLSLWARGQTGLRNLWAMSTEAYRDGSFDGKPRMDWQTIERLGEDVICGTGCLRGPVSVRILAGDLDGARESLMRLSHAFPGRLYVELHANTLQDQKTVNLALLDLAREYGLPLVMAVDSHYARPEQKPVHQVWNRMATNKTLGEETSLFGGDQDYHLLTEDEIREHCAYLPDDAVAEAMGNTVEIARSCTAEVRGEVRTPTYSNASPDQPDPVQRDFERLMEICEQNWVRRTTGKRESQQVYLDRLEREVKLLVAKQFCGYFMIVWDYVAWAKDGGCLVGPSRGSGGGSLVAYLMGITETDPVEHDLIFERFLTEGRTSLPDFDIDFPTSWRARVTNYLRERWGDEYTSNIGTNLRLRSKQAFNDVYRTLRPVLSYEIPYAEQEALKKAIDAADAPLAGKHLSWDDFCAQFATVVDPMRSAYPEVLDAVDSVVDRLKTYGKHAAGVVISTHEPLTDLPMYLTEYKEVVDGKKVTKQMMVTQFDMNALEILGYVKFDILTLRTLDTLQVAVDLIQERHGRRINPYDWTVEYEDPQVWEQVAQGRTLGLFQVETTSGTQMIRRMAPGNLEDLAAVVTIVRPGPRRSGLTESYLRRRAGIEPVTYPDARMEGFVGNTYGSMIYQEQVMAACMTLAGYSSDEADKVRKLLGKKQVELVIEAGQKFVSRAVPFGTDPAVADLLWSQMAEFAKYGFNRAHAFAYAVVGLWTAWLKFHFPAEFLVACLSTVDNDRIPDFIDECRMLGYEVRHPSINESASTFSVQGLDVVYGISLVKGVGQMTADHIVRHQPYSSVEDFLDRAVRPAGSPVDMGHVKILAGVGAFDGIFENRRALEMQIEDDKTGVSRRCVFKTDVPVQTHPSNLRCCFDWSAEPDPPMLPKGRGKAKVMVPKSPPRACTSACRQYTRPDRRDPGSVEPYSMDEIVAKEREVLGVWISESPWKRFDPVYLDRSDTAEGIETGPVDQEYVGVCLVEGVKTRLDVNGNTYAFVELNMQDGRIEPVCFASTWDKHGRDLVSGEQGVAVIYKTPRGLQLSGYSPYTT